MEKDQIDINTIWETFKRKLKAAIDENIPSTIFKRNNNLPWMTKSLRRMVRRKVRLYRAAIQTGPNTKKHKKRMQEAISQSGNTVCQQHYNWRPGEEWSKAKAKKQDNIGIAPLRHKGSMTNDSKEKAYILNDQFKYVFTKSTPTTLEMSTIDRGFNIKTLKIGEQAEYSSCLKT